MGEEFDSEIVTLVDEETGDEIELEFVDALEHNGTIYRAFFPVTDEEMESADDQEYGLIILKAETVDGEEVLAQIEGEDEINTVYNLFMERFFAEENE